jgi:hypothetical protein
MQFTAVYFYGLAIVHEFAIADCKGMLGLGIHRKENAGNKEKEKDPFFHGVAV